MSFTIRGTVNDRDPSDRQSREQSLGAPAVRLDLRLQPVHIVKPPLVAQPLHESKLHLAAVKVTVESEHVGLDRRRGAVAERGVDANVSEPGVHDSALTKADAKSPRSEPTAQTLGGGVPKLVPQETMLMLPYRDPNAFELIRRHKDELAVVLIEPVQSSNPRLDAGDFLHELLEVCRASDVLLLLDEVITGFRIEYGGCQQYYGLTADLATYGKAIGGGLPVGAVGGRADIMNGFSGKDEAPYIFSGGTFSGNPLTMAAGIAAVSTMRDQRDTLYPYLHEQGARFQRSVNEFCADRDIPAQVMMAGSMFHLVFEGGEIRGERDISRKHRRAERQFYLHLLANGVIIPGIHLAFFSAAHTPDDIDEVQEAFRRSLLALREDALF